MSLNPVTPTINRSEAPPSLPIIGDAIRLRPLDRSHLDRTLVWVNDPELSRLLDRAKPVTPVEHEQWFSTVVQRRDCLYLAIETLRENLHVGNVWLWDIDERHRRAEVRILLGDASAADRGLGTEALRLLASYAFDHMKLHKLYAYVLDINPRACRAFEKAGFEREGVLRADRWSVDRYVDVHLLARLRPESS